MMRWERLVVMVVVVAAGGGDGSPAQTRSRVLATTDLEDPSRALPSLAVHHPRGQRSEDTVGVPKGHQSEAVRGPVRL